MITRAKLDELLRIKTGASMSAEDIVEHLIASNLLQDKRLRDDVIMKEYFRRMRDPKNKNSYDVEQALAAEFDVTDRYVRWLRTRILKNRK